MENTLDWYLSLFDDLKERTNEEVALALLQEIAKDRRTELMIENGQNKKATQKQLDLLEKLNVEHDKEISKKEASQLIDEALNKDHKS